MYAISVIFEVDPAHLEDFRAAALHHADCSRTREPDCLGFGVFQSAERPDLFYFHELYADKAAVSEVHDKAPYKEEFGRKTEGWIRARRISFWNGAE